MISEDQLEQRCLNWFGDEGYAYEPEIGHEVVTGGHFCQRSVENYLC